MVDVKPQAPLIGPNFSGPVDNGPRKSLQSKDEVEAESTPEKTGEEKLDEVVESKRPLTAAEKAKRYREGLEEAGIPLEKARAILDAVIFKNCYIEDVVLLGRLKVGIRTRVYEDLQRIMHALETEAPAFPVHTDDLVARYNVAASLAYYQDHRFEFPDPGTASLQEITSAFEKRMQFLMSLSTPVVSSLIEAVNKFDRVMATVFAEGAPEDF
jgi:hypothetical protein